ncbi:hypothetical protein [Aureimonas sp. AU40]|uniref:hypothetical protein n=1 Tax=Aureimonas sp. AU40 TaxID=1637747 RepID=UPI000782C545|nr:hypothetical protein [Aureimonas sp. AU40]
MIDILPPSPDDLDAGGRDLVDDYALDRIYLSDVLAGLPHLHDVHGVRRRMRERGMIGDAASSARLIDDLRRRVASGEIDVAEAERRLTPAERVAAALAVLDRIPPIGNSDAAEEEVLADLRRMREEDEAARLDLVSSVRDDLLAGRISKSAAIERVGLRGWSEICASLDDEALRRVLGGDL